MPETGESTASGALSASVQPPGEAVRRGRAYDVGHHAGGKVPGRPSRRSPEGPLLFRWALLSRAASSSVAEERCSACTSARAGRR
jgi:hypothetical protein